MSTELKTVDGVDERTKQLVHHYQTTGDMTGMSPEEELMVMDEWCRRIGLDRNALPFSVLETKPDKQGNTRRVLYPKKECAEQLRTLRQISFSRRPEIEVEYLDQGSKKGWLITAYVFGRTPNGVEDVDIGSVFEQYPDRVGDGKKRALTQGKRRLTFSMGGLGQILDIAEKAPERPSGAFEGSDDSEPGTEGDQQQAEAPAAPSGQKLPPLQRFIARCEELERQFPLTEAYDAILKAHGLQDPRHVKADDTDKMKAVVQALEAAVAPPTEDDTEALDAMGAPRGDEEPEDPDF